MSATKEPDFAALAQQPEMQPTDIEAPAEGRSANASNAKFARSALGR